MTNNILDVLTYMFDYLFEEAEQESSQIDDIALKAHLSEAGFETGKIDKALSWLENIATLQDGKSMSFEAANGGMRIYSEEEKSKIDAKSRGFLLFMENLQEVRRILRLKIPQDLRKKIVNQILVGNFFYMSIDPSFHLTGSPSILSRVPHTRSVVPP